MMFTISWGLFEDCPDKLLVDVRKARLKRDQEESVHVLADARKLFEQGNLPEAERQAHRAERLHGPYSMWELGDRPQKLLVPEYERPRRTRWGAGSASTPGQTGLNAATLPVSTRVAPAASPLPLGEG